MLWKVIVFLVFLVIALVFIVMNQGNRSDVDIPFYKWQQVPVYLSMGFSFALGVLCMVPFLVRLRFSSKLRGKAPAKAAEEEKQKGGPPDAPPAGQG